MTGLHLLGLYLDGYIEFGFTELLVPFASDYRPLAVAIGVLSFYVMVADPADVVLAPLVAEAGRGTASTCCRMGSCGVLRSTPAWLEPTGSIVRTRCWR